MQYFHNMKNLYLLAFLLLFTAASAGVNYEFSLPSVVRSGQFIGKVEAYDPNVGQTLTFYIVDGNTNYKAFRIDSITGDLRVNNAPFINARKKLDFYLTVRVTDSGGFNKYGKFVRLSAQAIIHIYRTQ